MIANAPTRRRRFRLGALVLVVVLGLAACTPEEREQIAGEVESAIDDAQQDGDATEAPETEAQTTEEPQTEEPQTEEPATEEPEPTEDTTTDVDEGDPTDWLPWLIWGLVALALLAMIMGAISRRRARRDHARARVSRDLGEVIGTGRWILDQGTTEALRLSDPRQLERSWQSTRQQMVGLEEDMSRMLVDAEGDPLANALRASSEASSELRSAIDADVSRRLDTDSPDDPALAQSMRETVQERRNRFRETLDRLATFR